MDCELAAVIQKSRSFPHAALRRSLQVVEKWACGVPRFQHFHGPGRAVDDNSQFVVEIVSGGCYDGAGPVGSREAFHTA